MRQTRPRVALILGAGPAGLTAALEFCRRSQIRPIVFEQSNHVGGLSCTLCHNGNRLDLGGHRFFSKSDRVMDWWTGILPLSTGDDDPQEAVMLVRPRHSRIFFSGRFFDYPLSLSWRTLRHLGLRRTLHIALSYAHACFFPRRQERTLEDFFINRFGHALYDIFFRSYTEKVWGVPCHQISAEWGSQRIKGLSLRSAVNHFLKKLWKPQGKNIKAVPHKDFETSLIEHFLYPKLGPGQMWERVADLAAAQGAEIRLGWKITGLNVTKSNSGLSRVTSVEVRTPEGEFVTAEGDFILSTIPVRHLLKVLHAPVPVHIETISNGLVYRDFITVGLLVDRLLITGWNGSPTKDTWLYIQEPGVLLSRLQIFNNWSPHLVADPSKIWLGLEYFCNDTDPLWRKTDAEMTAFAVEEIARLGFLNPSDVRDSCVYRVPKAYPAYLGTYARFPEIINYLERFENLFLVGRNGMHRYNNQDHSMLAAMTAVDQILSNSVSREDLWRINTEEDYHEERRPARKSF